MPVHELTVVECKQRARLRLSHRTDAWDAMVLTRPRNTAVGDVSPPGMPQGGPGLRGADNSRGTDCLHETVSASSEN
jgi:hypothetical protein